MGRPEAAAPTVETAGAIEELLLPVLASAYKFALRLTGDEADAEDLLQEAAARACKFFHRYRPGTNFRCGSSRF